MHQRDLLKDQIEQLGAIIASIVFRFRAMKSNMNETESIDFLKDRLKHTLDIDTQHLLLIDQDTMLAYLKERTLHGLNLERLSEVFIELASAMSDPSDKRLCLTKAIALLDLADQTSQTFSLSRSQLRQDITNELHHGE